MLLLFFISVATIEICLQSSSDVIVLHVYDLSHQFSSFYVYLTGATDSEFCVYNVDHISKQGSYFCMVSNDFGGKVISKSAILLIAEITTKPKYSGQLISAVILLWNIGIQVLDIQGD